LQGNNLVNNGTWGIRATGEPSEVRAGNNWWGSSHPMPEGMTDGSVSIETPLQAPIHFDLAAGIRWLRDPWRRSDCPAW